MAAIAIGDCVGEGFGLIRRRPFPVLCWGLIYTAPMAGFFAMMAPFYMRMFTQMAAAKAGVPPTADVASMMQMQGAIWLFDILLYFVLAVINCAVFRSVLLPEDSRFAYLRIGAPELFVFVLMIGAAFAFGFGFVVVMIPIAVIAGIAMATHVAAVGIILGVVGAVVALVAAVYVALRLSLAGPMTVHDGQFRFSESWALTKGSVGSLFAIALCLVAIVFGVEVVLSIVVLILGVGVLSAMPDGLAGLPQALQQHPAEVLQSLTPAFVIAALASIPFSGCFLAVFAAPWAKAYQQLAGPDIAATFS
jgi:hypothetical protein